MSLTRATRRRVNNRLIQMQDKTFTHIEYKREACNMSVYSMRCHLKYGN